LLDTKLLCMILTGGLLLLSPGVQAIQCDDILNSRTSVNPEPLKPALLPSLTFVNDFINGVSQSVYTEPTTIRIEHRSILEKTLGKMVESRIFAAGAQTSHIYRSLEIASQEGQLGHYIQEMIQTQYGRFRNLLEDSRFAEINVLSAEDQMQFANYFRSRLQSMEPRASLSGQSAEARAIVQNAVTVLTSSFDMWGFGTDIVRQLDPVSGNQIDWAQPMTPALRNYFEVIMARPNFKQMAANLSQLYRWLRPARSEHDKEAIDRLQTIEPVVQLQPAGKSDNLRSSVIAGSEVDHAMMENTFTVMKAKISNHEIFPQELRRFSATAGLNYSMNDLNPRQPLHPIFREFLYLLYENGHLTLFSEWLTQN
jgi:hypothetical protein